MAEDQTELKAHDRIYNLLIDEEQITWKSIIYELIQKGDVDPWDIDVSLLSQKYLKAIKEMKSTNLNVPAKVILASALLLRIKSRKLLKDDINALDQLLTAPDSDEFYEDLENEYRNLYKNAPGKNINNTGIVPRTPQPRKRKVSVFDLVKALDKALEVKNRRPFKPDTYKAVKIPDKKFDIGDMINTLKGKIFGIFQSNKTTSFSQILPSKKKIDVVHTFVPLLHMANHREIDLEQQTPFGDIKIHPAGKLNEKIVYDEYTGKRQKKEAIVAEAE